MCQIDIKLFVVCAHTSEKILSGCKVHSCKPDRYIELEPYWCADCKSGLTKQIHYEENRLHAEKNKDKNLTQKLLSGIKAKAKDKAEDKPRAVAFHPFSAKGIQRFWNWKEDYLLDRAVDGKCTPLGIFRDDDPAVTEEREFIVGHSPLGPELHLLLRKIYELKPRMVKMEPFHSIVSDGLLSEMVERARQWTFDFAGKEDPRDKTPLERDPEAMMGFAMSVTDNLSPLKSSYKRFDPLCMPDDEIRAVASSAGTFHVYYTQMGIEPWVTLDTIMRLLRSKVPIPNMSHVYVEDTLNPVGSALRFVRGVWGQKLPGFVHEEALDPKQLMVPITPITRTLLSIPQDPFPPERLRNGSTVQAVSAYGFHTTFTSADKPLVYLWPKGNPCKWHRACAEPGCTSCFPVGCRIQMKPAKRPGFDPENKINVPRPTSPEAAKA